jgi:hypothetical protein
MRMEKESSVRLAATISMIRILEDLENDENSVFLLALPTNDSIHSARTSPLLEVSTQIEPAPP